MEIKHGWWIWLTALAGSVAINVSAENLPIKLDVDATDAPRDLLHARLHIPASPGKLTLFYPKWIPGEHSPTGPINNVTGLAFTVNGKPVEWQRDAEDMFAFHLQVPPGADAVDVSLDFLLAAGGGLYSSGASATARLLDFNWNQVLLYPQSLAALKTPFVATLRLPPDWKFGTALPVEVSVRNKIKFFTVPLETLIDSPVIAGEFFRTLDLAPGDKIPRFMHIVADNAADLEIKPEDEARFQRLMREAEALFGARHYRSYHFLVTLSEHVAHFGLEHHESSDDRLAENFLTDEDARTQAAELMPHELVHSWNGKFRRPAGLATPDYQQPMHGELLWVYEGLTDYLGKVLAARSGLMTTTNFRAAFALTAAMLDRRDGRSWRTLADTTVAAQLLYDSSSVGTSRRRSTDFYPEGDLIWLEVDTRIRQQTQGKKSLDDFCKQFHGGENSSPAVVPYDLDEITKTLNKISPDNWKEFFQQRVYAIAPHAPVGGMENGGWKLAYTNEVPALLKIRESQRKLTDMSCSLGFTLGTDGVVGDVLPGSPAEKAGVSQGMKLVAVNGRGWSAKILREAVKTAVTNRAPLELLTERDSFYQVHAVNYRGGEKYPVLERNNARPDLIGEIIKPLLPEPATNGVMTK